MMYGHFDSSSLWHCNFNPFSENYNDIYPKLLEQYDIERSTYETFVGEVNKLIKNLNRRLKTSSMIRQIKMVHIVLSILTLGLWLPVFGLWFIFFILSQKSKAVKETEKTKMDIERLISNANSKIFHPKGLDVISIYDIEKEKRLGVDSFLESYILIQTCKSSSVSEPETVRAQPSSVTSDHEEEYMYYKSSNRY